MRREERREIVKHILDVLLTTGAIIIASQSPYFINRLVRSFFKNPRWTVKDLARCFWNLKYIGDVAVKKGNGKFEIKLTPKGRKKINHLNFWDIKLGKEKRWDKKWRIIIFDIPKKIDRVREMFRLKLREFGFYQLQKSVWIYPYKCEKEIAYLRELLGAENYIKVIITKSVELDDEIFNFFHLNPQKVKKYRLKLFKNKRICVKN